jgi:hypothetical protein
VSSRLLCTSFATAIEVDSMCLDTYPRRSAVLPSEREANCKLRYYYNWIKRHALPYTGEAVGSGIAFML